MEWINDQIECLNTLKERLTDIFKENNEGESKGIERAIHEINQYEFELCLRGIESLRKHI